MRRVQHGALVQDSFPRIAVPHGSRADDDRPLQFVRSRPFRRSPPSGHRAGGANCPRLRREPGDVRFPVRKGPPHPRGHRRLDFRDANLATFDVHGGAEVLFERETERRQVRVEGEGNWRRPRDGPTVGFAETGGIVRIVKADRHPPASHAGRRYAGSYLELVRRVGLVAWRCCTTRSTAAALPAFPVPRTWNGTSPACGRWATRSS